LAAWRVRRQEWIAATLLANGADTVASLIRVEIQTRIEDAAVRLGLGHRVAQRDQTRLRIGRAVGLQDDAVEVIRPDTAVDVRGVAIVEVAGGVDLEGEA